MANLTEPRLRISAKQSTKNIWTLDATVEFKADEITQSTDPKDVGNTETKSLGEKLLELIKETENQSRADGRIIAGDSQ